MSWPELLVEKAQEAAKEADIASTRARKFEDYARGEIADPTEGGGEGAAVAYAMLSVGARIEAAEWSLISAWMVNRVASTSTAADATLAELLGDLMRPKP